MTDMKLRELLVVIDDHYGRARSLEERRADTQIYIRAFGTIPDEIVEKALYTAFVSLGTKACYDRIRYGIIR